MMPLDVELEAVAAGAKPACLKESVRPEVARELVAAAEARNLRADIVHLHGRTLVGAHTDGTGFATVAIAREAWVLTEVIRQQRAHTVGAQGTPVREMGALLGYPACCVDAFMAQPTRGDNVDNEKLPFRRAPHATFDPLVNRLARSRVISHHLCAPDCAASVALARKILDVVPPADAERITAELSRPILFINYELRAEVDAVFEGDKLVLTSLRSIDGEFPMFVADAPHLELLPTGIVGAGGRKMTCHQPLFVRPGSAIDPPALAAAGGPSSPHSPPPRLELPAQFRRGVRAGALTIGAMRSSDGAHRIELVGPGSPVVVTIRAHEQHRPYAVRRGKWALDLDPSTVLDDVARAAIAALVRALPP